MDWCPIQGESVTLIRLAPRKPELSTGLMSQILLGKDLTYYNEYMHVITENIHVSISLF